MGWEAGQSYRGRGVRGQIAVMKNANGTPSVEALIEVSMGPQQGQRVRWRGYLNTPKNVEATTAELRAMGWTGTRWGDWAGFGSREVSFVCMVDEGTNAAGESRTYVRAGWVREVQTLKSDRAMSAGDLEGLLPPAPMPGAARVPQEAAAGGDEIPF